MKKSIILIMFLSLIIIVGSLISTSFAANDGEVVLKCGRVFVYDPNKTYAIGPNQPLTIESSDSNRSFTNIQYSIDGAVSSINQAKHTFNFPIDAEHKKFTVKIKGSYDGGLSWTGEKTYYFHPLKVIVKYNNKEVEVNNDYVPYQTKPVFEVKPGDKIVITGDPADLLTHVSYVYCEIDETGKYLYGEHVKYLSGKSYSYVVPEDAVGKYLWLICGADNRGQGYGDVNSVQKNYKFKVVAPEETVTVKLTKQDDGILAKATVTNGTFKQFSYAWDNETNSTSTKNPTTISYPTAVGNHTLKVTATTQSGKKSSTQSVSYEVVAQAEETVSVDITKQDDGVLVKAIVTNGTFKEFTYSWDKGTNSTSTKNPTTIAYPTAVGNHTLTVSATTQSGKKSANLAVGCEVVAQAEETVTVKLTKQDDGVLAKATVTNGTFKQLSYAWDNGTSSTSTKNPTTISYPTVVGSHTLKVTATTQSGKKSSTQSVSYEVAAQAEEKVTVKLTKQDDGVLAKATVTNGTFKQFSYAWDDGTNSTSTKNPTTISYPTAVGSHTLKVTATTQSGKKSSTQSVSYEVAAQSEEKVTVKLTKQDDGVLAKATVTNGTFKQFTYSWDDGTNSTSTKNPATISYPTAVGSHTLKVTATTQSGKKSSTQSVSYEVAAQSEETITVKLTKQDDGVLAKATVTNGTFKQFTYSWDNGTDSTSTKNPTTISYPTAVGKHTLKVSAVTINNKTSEIQSLNYEVNKPEEGGGPSDPEDPNEPSAIITAKISGKTVSERSSSPTSAKYGSEIIITLDPENEFSNVRYNWDSENMQVLSSERVIKVPNFDDNSTHKLSIKGVLTDSNEITKECYLYVPSEYQLDLEIDPWMEDNESSEGLLISLRNKSDLIKANKNYYMLNEEINYLIDYKNADNNTTDEIKVELKLPLAFEVVDTASGMVDKSKKTITWTYSEGLKHNESDTRRVVVKYTALSKKSSASEMVYPQATIYRKGKVQDVSSVINCIYLDDETLFEEKHTPYMLGDQGKATFRPNDGITRAEGALVLMRIFGVKFNNVTTLTDKFSDLDQTYLEAQRAITKATEIGIINGYPDGTYRPKSSMTRAEFMKIIAAYIESNSKEKGLEVKDKNAVLIYKDNGSKAVWAIPYVTLLVRLNMTPLSYNEKDLRLDENVTRAEVAQLCNFYLFRAPAKVSLNTTTNFDDVTTSHKLIGDIVEATRAEHKYTVTSDGKEKEK